MKLSTLAYSVHCQLVKAEVTVDSSWPYETVGIDARTLEGARTFDIGLSNNSGYG